MKGAGWCSGTRPGGRGLRGLDALPAEDPLVRSGALLLLLLLLRRVPRSCISRYMDS